MKPVPEKELRLALVCYGGVSLAVYMHGVTKEILKLVRASKFYQKHRLQIKQQDLSYHDVNDDPQRETDSERVYFELLKAIGQKLDLRVIVDVIAGASAGGINGIVLARALAHDLAIDNHRSMWLELADITELMDAKDIAGRWSKAYLQPLLWQLSRGTLQTVDNDHEVRSKISTFLRSRWFRPPFSGERFTAMLLDALHAMEPASSLSKPSASLLPSGHQLDLFVTLTDFYGYSRSVALYDPPWVDEREHRHVLKFSYLQRKDGHISSDLSDDHIPELAFAARATSSFAGAFPPVQLHEIDKVLAARGENWPGRQAFMLQQFRALYESGGNPLQASFIDGGVLNNKPFMEAIQALSGRPAHREVERFLIYLEPCPESALPTHKTPPPGYFLTLRGAMSDLLRNQPIHEELEAVNQLTERRRRFKKIISAARPRISRLIQDIINQDQPDSANKKPLAEYLARWRILAKSRAASDAGYTYPAYIQLRIMTVLENLALILSDICRHGADSQEHHTLTQWLGQWVQTQQLDENTDPDSDSNPCTQFLRHYDVHFGVRRLRFVIRRLNELYQQTHQQSPDTNKALGEFKAALYEALDRLLQRVSGDFYSGDLRNKTFTLLNQTDTTSSLPMLANLLTDLSDEMMLAGQDQTVDGLFSSPCWQRLENNLQHELLLAYLGFSFFDVLTLPIAQLRDLDELDEVKVVRFSADDATSIRPGGARATLKGTAFGYFGGFFSRRYRENDYLWGRLHSADRLVDVIMQAAFAQNSEHDIDIQRIKQRLFNAILDIESGHLQHIDELITTIRSEINEKNDPAAQS